ncbi:MAG: T9SS type A sorting domain-containing protein [Chitinophagaceae bacterium]
MKTRYFLLIFLVLSVNVKAQKIRFTDTTNVWTMKQVAFEPRKADVYRIEYLSDTVINNILYHQLPGPGSTIAVREDTVKGIVYFRFMELFTGQFRPDTAEHVFFDYNLAIGDTLTITLDTLKFAHIVQSIDSVTIAGSSYKVWVMGSMCGTNGYTFIEGIGTTEGPTEGCRIQWHEGCKQIKCFSNQYGQPLISPSVPMSWGCWPMYRSGFDNDSSCKYQVAVPNVSSSNPLPIILPNPGGKESILKLPPAYANATLTIIDAMGRKCLSMQVLGKSEIPFGQYLSVPGVYYYSLEKADFGERSGGHFVYR